MRRGRLLLPWGLLAGLLILTAAIEGLKAPSLLKKTRNGSVNATTTTTNIPASTSDMTASAEEEIEEHEEPEIAVNVTEKSLLTGNPQEDYRYDPNLPRELPPGYNLSSYPFFSRVPSDVNFVCTDDLLDGYYANVEYKCQVYHHCLSGIRYDFLCANYTAFDQKTFICHFVSEVDCANSAKFWNRNKGLYETPTTTTVAPLTPAPTPAPARRPAPAAGAAGRRRRPYRRRRPSDYYYYDEEYDDEYEDDFVQPGQGASGRSKRPDASAAPSSSAATPSEPAGDEKPFKADSSIYDRPRQPPKIRRPVPVNERDKYQYTTKESGDKKTGAKDDYERPSERDYDRKRPQESSDYDKPRGQEASRSRPKPRPPPQDDEEYYDDEDYEQPRTPSRKNQDYYAPSGGDRDFSRRPAMTGVGRPLRRNRPGSRRRPVDDDYYDDRRPYRSSDEEPRRRPSSRDEEPRRRPSIRDEEPRRRPSHRDEDPPRREEARRRPVSDEEPRRRPTEDDRRRPAKTDDDRKGSSSEEEVRRRPVDDEPRRRPATKEEDVRRRPTEPEEDVRRRPSEPEEDVRRRPSAPEDDSKRRPTAASRKRVQQRDEYEKDSSYEKEKPTRSQSSRDSERPTGRDAGYEKPSTTGRDSSSERPREKVQSSRDVVEDRPRPSRVKDEVAPTGPGSTFVRPLTRGHTSRDVVESDEPIPAPKPAFISTVGRGAYRKRVQDEEVQRGTSRHAQPLDDTPPTSAGTHRSRTTPTAKLTTEHVELPPPTASSYRPPPPVTAKTTEAPIYDDEYYDDEEEEGLEEQPLPSVTPIKKPTTRGREEVYDQLDIRGRFDEDRRASPTSETRVNVDTSGEVDGTGRVVASQERIQARPVSEHKRPPPSSSYHFNSDDVLVETSTRQPFRPKSASVTSTSTTTPATLVEEVVERHNYQSNYRRKSNQASNIETTKVLAPNDSVDDVRHSSTTHSTTTPPPVKTTTAHSVRLETEKFEVRKPLDSFPSTGKSTIHYLKHGGVRFPDEFPQRGILSDLNDYDVTLNEAVHPTRHPLNDGTTRIKIKVPVYQFGTNIDPTGPGHLKKSQTLLSSASQTHISKAPFPVHDKPIKEEDYDDLPLEDDYEDTDIPTGKGATKSMYQETQLPADKGRYEWSTTPSALRVSEVSLPPSRGATGHYIVQQTTAPRQQQHQGFTTTGRFEQQPVLSAVRNSNGQQYLRPREPVVYHGGLNPLTFGVGYDYDYRPQRKYVRRGAYDYFGKPY